jgi:WD40 repeat protein
MHEGHVTDVQFSPDGRRIATASRDMTVRLWDAANGQPLSGPLRHDAPVERVRFEPGGERIVASTASAARVWDAPDFSTPPPEWLAPLAEMVSLCERPIEPAAGFALIAKYEQTRAAAMREPGDGAYARLAHRLFGTPSTNEGPK